MTGEQRTRTKKKKIEFRSWDYDSDSDKARALIKNMIKMGSPIISRDNVMCYLVYNDMGIHTNVVTEKNLRATFDETSEYLVRIRVRRVDDTTAAYINNEDGSAQYIWTDDVRSIPGTVIDTAFGFLDKDLFEVRGTLSHPIIDKNGDLVVLNGLTFREKDEKGTLVKKPVLNIYNGYDPVSQNFFAIPERVRREFTGMENLKPTKKQVSQAVKFIYYFFCDFKFKTESSFVSALAFMLSMFCRELIREASVPMLQIRAAETRTGKTLLGKMMITAMTGEIYPVMFSPNFRNIEEFEKEIFSILMQGRDYVFMDNITTKVQSSFLDMALTTGKASKRVLGTNQEATVYSGMPFLMTANNPTVSEDMKGRVYTLNLIKQPDDTVYRHTGKEKDARAMGPAMLKSLYILYRNWVVNYNSELFTEKKIPGYEEWSGVIGGIITAAGFEGFLDDTLVQINEVDPRREEAAELARVWLETIGGEWVLVKDVLEVAVKAGCIDGKAVRDSQIQTLRNKLLRMMDVPLPGGYVFQKNAANARGSEWRVVMDEEKCPLQ